MTARSKSFSIKNWAPDDRPRERLLRQGSRALTVSELLAILIGSGNRAESALDLSKRIIAETGDLNSLGKLSLADLMQYRGIGQAKAVTIAAALELGRRRSDESLPEQCAITSSKQVFAVMRPLLGELGHEEFWILYLNNSNRILNKKQLSKGGITGTLVDVRLALKHAIECSATALILVHNHPSGALKPSHADSQLTKKMQQACESLDLKVLDHVIITEKTYFSFADEALL